MRIKFILVFVFLLFSKTNATFAQDVQEIVKLREQLVSPWIITFVGKDPVELAFRIKGITSKGDGTFILDATYGAVGANLGAVEADLVQQDKSLKINITTKLNSKMNLEAVAPDLFQGSFTNTVKNSVSKITVSKISEDDLNKKIAEIDSKKPSTPIPEVCLAFNGMWAGTWKYDQREIRLWVDNIKSNCSAKISYRTSSNNIKPPPSDFWDKKIETESKSLSVPCSTAGNCLLTLHGNDELWANIPNGDTIVLRKK